METLLNVIGTPCRAGYGPGRLVLRGTLMDLVLFAILRFVGHRQTGHFGLADLLVIVLIADAAPCPTP